MIAHFYNLEREMSEQDQDANNNSPKRWAPDWEVWILALAVLVIQERGFLSPGPMEVVLAEDKQHSSGNEIASNKYQHGVVRRGDGGGLFDLPIVYESMLTTLGDDGTAVRAADLNRVSFDVY
jgi:hypothetical protein